MTTKRCRFIVPIYGCAVTFVVADDLQEERNRHAKRFGDYQLDPGCQGLVSSRNGYYLLLLSPAGCTHGQIAHEIFHLTHGIMEWAGERYHDDHAEPTAYLLQWLTGRVYRRLEKWRVKVGHFR